MLFNIRHLITAMRTIHTKQIAIKSKFSFSSLQVREYKQKKKIPIQSLNQLYKQRQFSEQPNLTKQQFEPSELYLTLLRSLKKNLYQQPQSQALILHQINKYKNDIKYAKMFVNLILPIDNLFASLNQVYKQIAITYLSYQKQIHKQVLYTMLNNIERIIVENKTEWTDQDWILKDYTQEQKIMQILLPHLVAKNQQFDIYFFIGVAKICRILNVVNHQFTAYLVRQIEDPSNKVRLKEIIEVLNYLGKINSFPFQYFYANKQRWIKTLQSYNKFSTKKSFETIKMFEILILMNPVHCQLMIKRLQDILLQALPSLDNEELAHIWHLSTRARFGIYDTLYRQMLEKLMGYTGNMMVKELCLVVRGFGRFKYLNQYWHMSQYTLKQLRNKLSSDRVYEHQIINQILNGQTKKLQASQSY